jgi:tetratricopeptide (TPR) repeat protein
MRSTLDSVSTRRADDTVVISAWAIYYNSLADADLAAGDFEALRETRRRQVEVGEKLLAREPANLVWQRNLAVAYKYHGGVLHHLGERKLAREQYDKALELDRKGVEAEPLNPHRKLDLSFSHASIGSLFRDEGDVEGALGAYRTALRLRQEVFAADPDNEFAFTSLVRAHQSLAGVFANGTDLDRAVAEEREVLQLRVAWEAKHPSPYGRAAREASLSRSIADHSATIAASAHTPMARRRGYWRRAREEYSRSLATWLELAKGRALEGEYAAQPKQLREAIASCDEALAKLNVR